MIHENVKVREEKIVNSNNLGKFYKYVNKKLASRYGIGPLKDSYGHWSDQSCPRVTFLGPDPTRPAETLTRPDPRLPTKSLTRPDPRPTLPQYV